MRHKKDLKMKGPKVKRGLIWWALLSIIVVWVVVFTIETATSGATLARLERQEKQLVSENAELSAKLIEGSSLSSLENRSDELGFVAPQKIIYIGREEGFAKLP